MSPFCTQNLPLLYPLGLGTFGDTFGYKLGTRTDLGEYNDLNFIVDFRVARIFDVQLSPAINMNTY
jgi:hypothetical protein